MLLELQLKAKIQKKISTVKIFKSNQQPQKIKHSATDLDEKETDLAAMALTTDRVVAIGSSTGGTIALEKISNRVT